MNLKIENTRVKMFVRHRADEPTLGLNYDLRPYRDEFC